MHSSKFDGYSGKFSPRYSKPRCGTFHVIQTVYRKESDTIAVQVEKYQKDLLPWKFP